MRIERTDETYRMAEQIVHLEQALERANAILNNDGKLGVLPNHSVSFRNGRSFHKKVKKVLNKYNYNL